MALIKNPKNITEKLVAGAILIILVPLFAIRIIWWLITCLINYPEAKKELDFLYRGDVLNK